MIDNPFDLSREMMMQWERSMADAIQRLTTSEQFLQHMSSAFTSSVDIKRQTEEYFKKYLDSLSMPTKDDVQRILDYLLRIEGRQLDLEDRMADLQDRLASARPEPLEGALAPVVPTPKAPHAESKKETARPKKSAAPKKGPARPTSRPAKGSIRKTR